MTKQSPSMLVIEGGRLLRFARNDRGQQCQTFIVHGEPKASEALAGALRAWDWAVAVPHLGMTFTLK